VLNLNIVKVEAVDPVFQTKMLEMLKQTGRPEMVVGALLLTYVLR
jgi:26S proteasome regulatory subunit N11